MEKRKRWIAAGAVAGSMAFGAVAGAILFAPAASLAQDGTTSPSDDTSTDGSSGRGLCGPVGLGLEAAAEAIGIELAELRAALEDGQTIAEVAEANDVEVNTVIAAMVEAAEARIDHAVEDSELTEAEAAQKKEDLEARITAVVNGDAHIGHHGFPGRHRWGSSDGSSDATTEATVISV